MILGRIQFLLGCWTEGFYSLLAVGQFLAKHIQLLAMSLQKAALNMTPDFPQSECVREEERASKIEATVFM